MTAMNLTRTERIRAEFVAAMGEIAQAEGLSPIAGRILGLMIFDGEVYSFGDLALALDVSRGSISTNTRFLLQQGILERVERAGDRRDYYRIAPNAFAALFGGVERRARAAEGTIRATASALEPGDAARAGRLARLASFYGSLADAFGATLRGEAQGRKEAEQPAAAGA